MLNMLKYVMIYFSAFYLFVAGACLQDWIIENSGNEFELRNPYAYPRTDRPNLFYGKREFSCCTHTWDSNYYDGTLLDGIPTSTRFCLIFILGIPIFGIALGKAEIFYKMGDAILRRRLHSSLLTRSF